MIAYELRTEYLHDPVGIDALSPRFFWKCKDGVRQTAYQIICKRGNETVWNSGKVLSDAMTHIPYGGLPLKSRDLITWAVKLWDENGEGGGIADARFEMGLLRKTDWKAKWITGDYPVHKENRYPVDCFRKVVTAGDVVKARLYAAACGVYEGRLNGQRIGNFIMAPGYTDYRKRIQYQTYNVTSLLRRGGNELTFQLADGWYRGSCGAWGLKNQYGTETKLLVQLELTDRNGKVTTICSDGSWQWSSDGPIRFADNKDGEIVDARRSASFSGHAKVTSCNVVPTASNNVPVTEHETFQGEKIVTPSGKTVVKFPQNIAGYAAFRIRARAGQRIFLRFGEMLDKNGEFTQKNIQCSNKKTTSPLQQVEYICRDGLNEYKTTFAVFGFQYILVETNAPWRPEDFTAIAVYSDMKQTGFFESSNPLLDQFVKNTVWSAKSNFLDIPTDCPTRERHGWAGDAQIFSQSASYLVDFAPFAAKYLQDMYDWQRSDGCLPHIVPDGGAEAYMNPMNGSVGWADAGVLIPWVLWKMYGDKTLLEKRYEGMKKYASFMQARCGKKALLAKPLKLKGEALRYAVNCGQSYGEWAEPAEIHKTHWTEISFPHPEESTAYTCFIMERMASIAAVLGKDQDAKDYRDFAEKVRRSYQALSRLEEFTLETKRQARLVRPLYMKLLDKEQENLAKKQLLKDLDDFGWRLGTGFLSTPFILYVLSEINIAYAYRLLENEEVPGWLAMPKAGATTIWESWEAAASDGIAIDSRNHYSKGAVCEWLFAEMCGIQPNGENRFAIAPHPGGSFTYARAKYDSLYGTVESGWEQAENSTVYRIRIPVNCTAEVRLPGGTKKTVGAGEYVFKEMR